MKHFILVLIAVLLGTLAVTAQENTSTSYFGVEWSPDSKYLTFTKLEFTRSIPPDKSKPPSMKADVYTMRADGTKVKRITGDEQNELSPSWSKSGRIYFGAYASGNPKTSNIYSAKPDGSGLVQITKDIGRASTPNASMDGKKITFNVELIEHKPQIYTMNADGSNIKALTSDNTLAYYDPKWSPDGKKLTYYVEKGDQKDQIWTMNADGSDQTLLTANVAHNFYPSWSVDGKRIIFCSNRDGEAEVIYSMKPDGSDIRRFMKTNSPFVRFSPDGKRIAFTAGKFPANGILVANADGSNPIKITP
ncbi:hypothetical protein BH10ACI2_BH10ACI2_04990 [soil metagenome]